MIPWIFVVQMTANLTDRRQNNLACFACDSYYDNSVDHCIHECSSLVVDRAKLWHDISCISINAYAFLNSLNNSLVSNALLSMTNADLNNILYDEQDNFKHICVINLHNMWITHKRNVAMSRWWSCNVLTRCCLTSNLCCIPVGLCPITTLLHILLKVAYSLCHSYVLTFRFGKI